MSENILLEYSDVSTMLGIPVNTLKDYRANGKGPRSAVIAGRVKYRRPDVLQWLDEQFERTAKGGTTPVSVLKPLGRRSMAGASTACA